MLRLAHPNLKKNHRPATKPPSKIVRSLSIRHNFIFAKKKCMLFWEEEEVEEEWVDLLEAGISGSRKTDIKKTDQYEDVCVSWFKDGRNIIHKELNPFALWFNFNVVHPYVTFPFKILNYKPTLITIAIATQNVHLSYVIPSNTPIKGPKKE